VFLNCSTCFERHTAHRWELKNYNCSLWFYIRLWLLAVVVAEFLSSRRWAVCRSKHVEQLRNIGIINSTTQSHLVGYFYKIYIMMHGSMNIKLQVISRIGSQRTVYSWTCVFHGWGMAYNKREGEQLAWQVDILKIPVQFMKFQSHCPSYSEWTQYLWVPILIWRTSELPSVNSHTTVHNIDGIMYGYFVQKNAMAHIVKFAVSVLSEVSGKQSLTHGLSPLISLDLILCSDYLEGHIKTKFCEQSTSFTITERKYLKRNCLYFKARAAPCVNTLRTGSFKLFKRPFPGFLTILTL